jgi:hypothetical protein
MATRRFIVFVAHALGEGEDRAVIVHHLDLLPLHAGSVERRVASFGRVLASAILVEDDAGARTILPSRAEGEGGLTDREYREFLASCEDWAKGR